MYDLERKERTLRVRKFSVILFPLDSVPVFIYVLIYNWVNMVSCKVSALYTFLPRIIGCEGIFLGWQSEGHHAIENVVQKYLPVDLNGLSWRERKTIEVV